MKAEQRQLLNSWRQNLDVMVQTHYEISTRIRLLNYILGFPMIAFAVSVAAYVFGPIDRESPFWLQAKHGFDGDPCSNPGRYAHIHEILRAGGKPP